MSGRCQAIAANGSQCRRHPVEGLVTVRVDTAWTDPSANAQHDEYVRVELCAFHQRLKYYGGDMCPKGTSERRGR